ncbi:MAG: PIN-like domain-containing protein [Candidatus Electrothrix sp. GW3-4]|uniref:PIN-like domain-containing protein n=1 Tax=Candidatus Electrothrix sp. GW3-4 TaxID=3126740 RepID=UPI0030D1DB67
MKNLFPGYFRESQENLREIWDSCIFVFDANILLNLYRYSDTTRNEFLGLLEKIKDRVWLPHRAAEEYLNNRLSVIDQQERSYDSTIKSIESLKSDLDNARQHPFVSKQTMKKFDSVVHALCEELTHNKEVHTQRISNDEIKNSISQIFENRVGLPFEKEKLEKLIIEGEERYKQKIPPGFKDGSKSTDSEVFSERCRRFGDLIVWKQVLEHSIEVAKGVVLVTDDKKEDWWEKFKGKTIGPRPELVKEFKEHANNTFHMYQADRFLELARENLDEQVSQQIVEEVREVMRRDKMAFRKKQKLENVSRQKNKINRMMKELEHARYQLLEHQHEMVSLQEKDHMLETERMELRKLRESFPDDECEIEMEPFIRHYSDYHLVKRRLKESKDRYQELQHRAIQLEHELARQMKYIKRENAAAS